MRENGQELLSAKEIAALMGVSKQAVQKQADKEKWPFVEAKTKGGMTKHYILHVLPAKIQNARLAANPLYNNKEGEPSGKGGESPAPTVPAVRAPSLSPVVSLREIIGTPENGNPAAAWQDLPEVARNRGYDILLMVNRVRDILANAPRNQKTAALKAYAESVGRDHRSLYRDVGKADRALKAAQKSGTDTILAQIEAITPKWGRNRDRVMAFDREAVVYALAQYLTGERRNISDVYRKTVAAARANNWKTGTCATLGNYLRRLDPAVTTLSREGKKTFEADNIIKILRNYDEIPPNFMWCGDHHIFDVFVKLPDGKGGWSFKRPWLTSWLDMRSRSIMGWCISFAPNSRTIAMALSHAIASKNDPDFPQCGLPSSVYIDNGKDYRSQYLNGEEVSLGRIDYPDIMARFAALGIDPFYIDLQFDPAQNAWVKKHGAKFIEIKGVRVGGVYARLNIGQRYATAYHPWAKPIERMHRTLVQSFSRECPGWCGSGHEQRPEKLAFELKCVHPLLTIEEFCDRFYGWVVNHYHKQPHRGHGMGGRTPDEVFLSLMPEPQTCDPAMLDFALLKKDRVKIHNWGFNLHGRQFELDLPANLQGGKIANMLIGAWATIFFDYEFKTVRVYRDDHWYCNARPLNRASFVTPNDPAMVEKLKIAAYQKQAAAGTVRTIQAHPVAQDEVDEARMLLAMTDHTAPAPENGGEEYVMPDDNGCPAAEDEKPIWITRPSRYQGEILPLIASGRELTPEQQKFRDDFESSPEFLESRELYEAKLDYERYLSGGKGGKV